MTNPINRATLSSPRALAAWALVAYVAIWLFFTFFDWVLPGEGSFSGRSAGASFDSLLVMTMPVLAVLLAAHVTPAVAGARLIAAIALIEYAVALFFGFITLLIGLGAMFDAVDTINEVFDALGYFVLGLANLGLIAIAAYVVVRSYTGLGGKLPTPRSHPARARCRHRRAPPDRQRSPLTHTRWPPPRREAAIVCA